AASYGGYAGMDASGAGVLAGLYWTKLYDPDNPRPSDIQDYSLQLYYMLHELAHVFGAGIGEYYNLAQITDTTNTAPLLNINIDDSTDGFWSDKTDFFADPLMRFTSTSIRSAYLGAVRYSNLTAAVISGDYRNGIPSFDHYTVQVSDTNGQPVTSAEIKVWNVKGASPYASQLLFDGPTDANGQVVLPWGGIGDPHNTNNFLRLIKVYKNGLAIAKPKYVSIFDADIAKLVNGDSSYSVSIVANNPPTDISLSSNSIGQHQPLNTLVGTLATTDANADASFTYSFCGGADDTSFKISGNNLISAAVFDYATKNDYNICIQTINQDGSVFQKPFTITIINLFSATFNPSGAYNGWALESKAGNNLGGSVNNSGTSLIVGDDALNRQYKSILSFNTTALPDIAVITGITLKIKQSGQHGSNPFTVLNGLQVDIRQPYFGPTPALQASDFQAVSSQDNAGLFGSTPLSGWYMANLNNTAYTFINLTGTTQFRLHFSLASNNNRIADYLAFYGNKSNIANQPALTVQYVIP
ncbi:MAG: hypothetical protein WBW94_15235, partial [Anaerolineales bacterium]